MNNFSLRALAGSNASGAWFRKGQSVIGVSLIRANYPPLDIPTVRRNNNQHPNYDWNSWAVGTESEGDSGTRRDVLGNVRGVFDRAPIFSRPMGLQPELAVGLDGQLESGLSPSLKTMWALLRSELCQTAS